jgi:hypothetical protein
LVEDFELLERGRELQALSAVIKAACQGTGRLAVVEGTAGIGKTRLLAAARAVAERSGLRVLGARGSELERDFPYGVVRQLFEPALTGAGRAELLAGAAGQAAALLVRLMLPLRRPHGWGCVVCDAARVVLVDRQPVCSQAVAVGRGRSALG